MMENRLLDVKGLARYLSMPITTVYAFVGRGKIPPECICRIGRSLKFDKQAIDAWISAQTGSQASAQEQPRAGR